MKEIVMDTAMLQPDILEKLWNGELYISEQCISADEEYKQILSEIDECYKKLESEIQENEKIISQIDRYIDLILKASEYRNKEAFKKGFGIAVSMILEAVKANNDIE